MSITPESVKTLLESNDLGDRLHGLNELRKLDLAIAFELIQIPLMDGNVRVRYAAVSQMGHLGHQNPDEALHLLKAALADPEPDVQAAAADAIGALKLTAAYDDLEQLYHRSPEWLVRFSILAMLGELGDARAFDLLAAALQSGTELEQTAAIGSLGELGDARAVDLLIPFASNPDWQVRHRIVQALSPYDSPTARNTLEALSHDEAVQVAEQAREVLKGA
jgi:HEAT repeat protein